MSEKSEINKLPTIERVFDLLDAWRHLPAYQLERRADIFFALFLPEVLEKHFNIALNPILVPEFPIRKSNVNRTECAEEGQPSAPESEKDAHHLSNKIDYFALSENREQAFLIELKTDMKSIDKKQICLLKRTSRKDPRDLIKDVICLARNPNNSKPTRQKYVHLLSHLRALNLVCYDKKELYEKAFMDNSTGVYGILKKVKPASWVCCDKPKLEVVYIQPKPKDSDLIPSDWHRIYFDCFAGTAEEKEEGSIGRRFAESLSKWKEPAGLCPPQS